MDGATTHAEKRHTESPFAPALSFHDDEKKVVAWYWLVQAMPGEWIGVYDPEETAKRRK